MMVAETQKNDGVLSLINVYITTEMQSALETPLVLPEGVTMAAALGLPVTAVQWMKAGGHVDAVVSDDHRDAGMTMLMLAGGHGHLGLVDLLIELGKPSVDFRSPARETAILLAAAHGHPDIVQRLCHAGSKQVLQAMVQAETRGKTEVMSVLSTHIKTVHASLWSGAGETLPTAIATAAAYGQEASVLAWIEGGGCVDATYSYKHEGWIEGGGCVDATYKHEGSVQDRTMLHFACEHNQAAIVNLLIKHDADTNLQDSDGVSPLIESAWRGHASIVSRL